LVINSVTSPYALQQVATDRAQFGSEIGEQPTKGLFLPRPV